MEEQELTQQALEALDEIDRILHQMLILAELSAGEGNVDRANLQKVLERFQSRIDCIADRLEETKNGPMAVQKAKRNDP